MWTDTRPGWTDTHPDPPAPLEPPWLLQPLPTLCQGGEQRSALLEGQVGLESSVSIPEDTEQLSPNGSGSN